MGIKVENANAWVNVADMKKSVPSMSFEESFGYATVLGLALADYIQKPQTIINVIPEEEKKILKKMYWIRFSSVAFSFLAILLTTASLLFLPSYFFSISKANLATSRLEAFNKANPEISTNNLDKTIADINSKLGLLSTKDSTYIPSEIILKNLISNLPNGITLNQINYSEEISNNLRTINIIGKASDRAALRNFKSTLDNNPIVALTDLPISNFIGKTNISFTILVTLK
jgi:hypothetical protein